MTAAPFLALITPIGTTEPPQPPLGIWGPTDPRPSHPIAGVPPGGAWPQPPRPPGVPTHPIYWPPYPDQGLPGNQPYPDQGLPGNQPYPDQGLPGNQPYPDQGLPGGQGGRPTHPIYFPPVIWGPGDPRPTPPIAIPPGLPPTLPEGPAIEWKVGWTPVTGWIVVGIPTGPHPTPSA